MNRSALTPSAVDSTASVPDAARASESAATTSRRRRARLFGLMITPVLGLAACASADQADTTPSSAGTSSAEVTQIAFFGFWKSNSFTQAVLKGVQEEAAKKGLKVVDRTTADYDAAAQAKAMRDETVSDASQMYVVLAADPVGMATAAKEARAKGVTVVAAFTPLGSDFTTLEPQVDGLVVVAETAVDNGTTLGEMAADACEAKKASPCEVAYLEGLKSLPLDNARTKAFVDTLADRDPEAKVVAQVEGGYTPDQGRKAAQDAMQRSKGIDVMVGSSQAILGAQQIVDTDAVALIGNGASKEAFAAVESGQWYALYNLDVVGMGATSVDQGLKAAAGESVEPVDLKTLRDPKGTKDVIEGLTSVYSDLG